MPTMTYSATHRRDVEGFIERDGRRFAWWLEHDSGYGTPWDNDDGHGPVSEWTRRDKRPGEMVLACDRHSRRFYDFAEAVRIAKADGWDAPPYGHGSAGQRAHRAAMADFRRLRDWCNDRWNYVGVCVQEVEDESAVGPVESLWGIESDADDYLRETAEELVAKLLTVIRASEGGTPR